MTATTATPVRQLPDSEYADVATMRATCQVASDSPAYRLLRDRMFNAAFLWPTTLPTATADVVIR
jgi:hypothetical protein